MKDMIDHLIIVPIVLPLVSGALMLLLEERRRALKGGIGIATTVILLVVSIFLLQQADEMAPGSGVRTYQLGNWPAPFGIVLVLDRLAALMLVLTSVLGIASLLYALARWHRAGPRFHTIFQIQLMGLNGAFLTGDLFNLFVFFEVLLAASYGLVLHGDGKARVRAGLAYIAINLTASLLFLIGASLAYGITGTLNMADLASRVPGLAPGDAALLAAAAAILGTAFLMKAGTWPLNFWLPTTYAAASAPAAAMFAIMSKLGVYVILRLWSLVFGPGAGPLAGFGGDWLLIGGMLTIVFGMVGVLASQSLPRLAGCSVLVSSGTLVAAIGIGNGSVIGSALFYLVSSTLGIAALFLLVELVERLRDPGADVLAVTMEAYGDTDDDPEEEIGVAIPATIALLGGSFIACALLLAGLPPLSGFVAKFGMMAAMLKTNGAAVPVSAWVLIALLTVSGLATLIAMTRSGITSFWARMSDSVPRVRIIEMTPVVALLLLALGLTVGGGPAMRYMEATAQALQAPQGYVAGVLAAPRAGEGVEETRP
ncbi:monovalent cation/H+ antiporter subunit D [Microvirga lotononidis]|uniref:Formate hydrogenlyase subunit 3/multisubunit Na+/H+ antiporter, MnhD subunit n=1 Tax=Microvirga lotononidis TaxID=864069 RepID=I4YKY3_9HYPH|nr:monovalent cation/H+ antiporter subunit D [Microvirga lotononidis]EIM24625.1 formate hydrogenlyase subunit 3/multisubunit Na+/H+ antiporter, MnhD subunit [Microvirga lotononidis]WQO26641.1 monovalent cation/H+ antiporter subunit D [Microvirga lotononidis]